ncbi:unnamed protein product, partial [Scytosiphon promiscuus]
FGRRQTAPRSPQIGSGSVLHTEEANAGRRLLLLLSPSCPGPKGGSMLSLEGEQALDEALHAKTPAAPLFFSRGQPATPFPSSFFPSLVSLFIFCRSRDSMHPAPEF